MLTVHVLGSVRKVPKGMATCVCSLDFDTAMIVCGGFVVSPRVMLVPRNAFFCVCGLQTQ